MKNLIAILAILLLGAGVFMYYYQNEGGEKSVNPVSINSGSVTKPENQEKKDNFHPVSLPAMFQKEFVGTDLVSY